MARDRDLDAQSCAALGSGSHGWSAAKFQSRRPEQIGGEDADGDGVCQRSACNHYAATALRSLDTVAIFRSAVDPAAILVDLTHWRLPRLGVDSSPHRTTTNAFDDGVTLYIGAGGRFGTST
jgi:hypothetical protein